VKSDSRREALADEIERHIGAEEAVLKEYHVLADHLPEGPLSILVNQITTEEEMHHFLLSTLAEWLRSEPNTDQSALLAGIDRTAIVDRARMLQDHEQATIDACSELKERVQDEPDELLEALLDVLILDSRKHHRLLAALDRIASN
jgi:rubrerythrin